MEFVLSDPPLENNNLDLPIEFPFSLDKFQLQAAQAVLKHQNALVSAHTGSGKTVPCLIAINHYLGLNKRVIYTSPVKSLSNQKFKEFTDHPNIPEVGIMTGDIKCNPDAQCVIMTTEILRNMLYKEKNNNDNDSESFLKDVGCVIFDEVHYINDRDRGKNWEESLIMLSPDIKLLMLSATIDRPELFAAWIGQLKQQPIHLIQTTKRPIPLNHYIYCENLKNYVRQQNEKKGLVHIMKPNSFITSNYDQAQMFYKFKWRNDKTHKMIKGKGNPRWSQSQSPGDLNDFLQFLKQGKYLPSLVFVLSRKRVEEYAAAIRINLVNHEQISQIKKVFNSHLHSLRDKYAHLNQYIQVFDLLKKGIGIHHSGLIPVLKEIVEILFSLGLIQVLFATETFAIGVNMPTKTVVFTELTKWDGHHKSMRPLKTDEYMQMAGRAGRRGLDSTGTIIHFPLRELPTTSEMKIMTTGNTPRIKSQMTISYQFLMKCMANDKNISEILDSSLMATELTNQNLFNQLEIEKLQKQFTNQKITFFDQYSQSDWDLCSKYHQTFNQIITINDIKITITKQERKKQLKLKKSLNPKSYLLFTEINKLDLIITDLIQHDSTDQIKEEINIILEFLYYIGYVNDKHSLSSKGLISANINDCNCILLTEMIVQGFFDHLTEKTILPFLAIFIDEKNLENQSISFRDLRQHKDFPPSLLDAIGKIYIIRDDLAEQEEKHFRNILPDTDWNLNLDFVLPSLIWCQGGNVKDIYQVCNIYEGNFIKGMLRLQSHAETIIEICDQIKQHTTSLKLTSAIELILRDIVTNNSLYVNQ